MTGREPGRGDDGLSPWFSAGTRPRPEQPDTAVMPVVRDDPGDDGPAPGPAGVRRPAAPGPATASAPGVPAPPTPGPPLSGPSFSGAPSAGPESSVPPVPAGPGRAERRRAAAAAARKGRGRGRRPSKGAAGTPDGTGTGTGSGTRSGTVGGAAGGAGDRPMTRVEARRAARAAKDSPAVIASRAMGELFITCGVVMLLFVTYQLWWTNVRAGIEAGKERDRIEQSFKDEKRRPGAFRPGEGFAIMYIPKLDVVVPVAEGIDKKKVLDRGMAGHYAEGSLKTAMPSDRQGNFGVAGHRNTHGEPFRYINRLKPGDPIVVETRDAYYTYEMASILPETSPSNVAVLDPVPRGSGFTEPGRYITLTTCTPEFTSTYRMIVWGTMVEERPRSKGKPDALVG
ncbi:class E sortase [Streptomyces sp. NPDC006798]|uniref:class E sortase n=1 Tax=Streptomyces sp. NPDC006798 TaxID=3155462 RepID=UPI0033F92A17